MSDKNSKGGSASKPLSPLRRAELLKTKEIKDAIAKLESSLADSLAYYARALSGFRSGRLDPEYVLNLQLKNGPIKKFAVVTSEDRTYKIILTTKPDQAKSIAKEIKELFSNKEGYSVTDDASKMGLSVAVSDPSSESREAMKKEIHGLAVKYFPEGVKRFRNDARSRIDDYKPLDKKAKKASTSDDKLILPEQDYHDALNLCDALVHEAEAKMLKMATKRQSEIDEAFKMT